MEALVVDLTGRDRSRQVFDQAQRTMKAGFRSSFRAAETISRASMRKVTSIVRGSAGNIKGLLTKALSPLGIGLGGAGLVLGFRRLVTGAGQLEIATKVAANATKRSKTEVEALADALNTASYGALNFRESMQLVSRGGLAGLKAQDLKTLVQFGSLFSAAAGEDAASNIKTLIQGIAGMEVEGLKRFGLRSAVSADIVGKMVDAQRGAGTWKTLDMVTRKQIMAAAVIGEMREKIKLMALSGKEIFFQWQSISGSVSDIVDQLGVGVIEAGRLAGIFGLGTTALGHAAQAVRQPGGPGAVVGVLATHLPKILQAAFQDLGEILAIGFLKVLKPVLESIRIGGLPIFGRMTDPQTDIMARYTAKMAVVLGKGYGRTFGRGPIPNVKDLAATFAEMKALGEEYEKALAAAGKPAFVEDKGAVSRALAEIQGVRAGRGSAIGTAAVDLFSDAKRKLKGFTGGGAAAIPEGIMGAGPAVGQMLNRLGIRAPTDWGGTWGKAARGLGRFGGQISGAVGGLFGDPQGTAYARGMWELAKLRQGYGDMERGPKRDTARARMGALTRALKSAGGGNYGGIMRQTGMGPEGAGYQLGKGRTGAMGLIDQLIRKARTDAIKVGTPEAKVAAREQIKGLEQQRRELGRSRGNAQDMARELRDFNEAFGGALTEAQRAATISEETLRHLMEQLKPQ